MVYLAHRFERHLHCVKMSNNNNKWWHRLQTISAKRNGNSNDTARHDKENVKDKTNLKQQEIDSSNIKLPFESSLDYLNSFSPKCDTHKMIKIIKCNNRCGAFYCKTKTKAKSYKKYE